MSKPYNLNTVLHDLKSEKVKERQQGLASLRNVFERDFAVLNLDETGKGQAWLSVFQALYTTIGIEKAASFKRSSQTAAIRRLGDAAATVRWLTERSVQRMNKAVVKSLFTHLTQTMVHNGELLTPVALDYIKALKCLVSWTPHMDHLNEDIWERMVQMAFNVILGDPIRQAVDEEEEPDHTQELTAAGTDPDSSEFFLDDDSDGIASDNLPSTSTAPNPRKRRQRDFSSAPSSSPRRKPKDKTPRSVSLEQIEFTSLLAILFQSPSTPLLSPKSSYIASAVLRRLYRFLERYPADSSLHHDYILCLSATLSHLALNQKAEVETFSREAWDSLLDLWKTKNKAIKEGLVSILRILFPYLISGQESASVGRQWVDGVQRLWFLLNSEAESRWGVDGLSLDALRLEIVTNQDEANVLPAFVAQTYRAGWHFDTEQALAWSILELQADCAEKLFQLSESFHTSTSKTDGKRVKLENPITSLLHSIQTHSSPTVRAYHLQNLLFFIDRRWSILHHSLQREVINLLLQYVSFDDTIIQSWTFLCFAAIAHADASCLSLCSPTQYPKSSRPHDAATWDPVWTHAIRRANVPGVCRAACHAACVLLSNAERLLTSQRILIEIETLAKDLDVQGPAFPFDSVCVFLAQCLKFASQDVRLHRMQIEEKVLSWLLDNWGVSDGSSSKGSGGGQTRMPLFMIDDMLMLLESICSFSKRVNVIFRVMLPDCPITETMVEQGQTKVIRDFLLNGRLPPFRRFSETGKAISTTGITNDSFSSQTSTPVLNVDLAQPRGRERRISTYLLKSLDSLASEFESVRDANGHPTAEKARQALDLAILALLFESLLMLNGTRSTKRVVQAACKIASLVITLLLDHRWSSEERALVLLALEPLTSRETEDEEGWEAIISPDAGAGIRTQILRRLIFTGESRRAQTRALRHNLQRMILHSTDVQDAFSRIMVNLRDVLRIIVGQKYNDLQASRSMNDGDDKDGFGPIRVTQQSPETRRETEDRIAHRYIVEVCVSFLAVIPILQSTSGESTRDKDLTDLVLQSDSKFHLIAPVLFKNIRQRLLSLSATTLDQFLDKFGELLKQYNYSRSENLQLLVTQFLDSTLHIWLQDSMANSQIVDKIRTFCHWISSLLKENKIRAWKLRDYAIRFLDRYIHIEPNQTIWLQDATDVESLPSNLLPLLGGDRDIRVRFRVAVVNARLFPVARIVGQNALILYDTIKRSLTVDLTSYEHMLTRILSLGNVMVASAAVRRGPYWHMLEICLHSQLYHRHIEAVLKGVSERLGLTSFSMLFEAYASQIAYSVRQAQSDFLRFPPHLLGYRDRKDCAEAAFRGFTPSNVLAAGTSVSDVPHGRRLFMNHCKVIQKSAAEGLRMCFGEIIGYQITAWIDDNLPTKDLDELMKQKIMNVEGLEDFDDLLRQHVDGIVIAILRTLQDQDFSQEGLIVQALQAFGKSGKVTQTFQALSRYRRMDDFETYPPNLPNYGTGTVLQSLAWFNARMPDTNSKATSYHILHELFAEVQHSPFVNEQVRLLNAISLWVAVHHDDFKELTLLHTLIRGATSILAQSDLARAAQSILEWAFTCYRRLSEKDPSFPDILIRISCLAYDYAVDAEDAAVAKMGNELVRWIDDQTLALCKSTTLRDQVIKALPAWPYQPSVELAQIFKDIASRNVSELLRDPGISSNKFRVSRRLRDFAHEKLYDEDDFATTDFWRLRDCLPSPDQLQDDDISAFTSLLVMNKGQIRSFWSDHPPTQSVRAQHLLGGNKKKSAKPVLIVPTPRRAIVVSLLAMLEGNTAAQVHVAYNTLRSLMSVLANPSSDIPHWHSWPAERRNELHYLQTYPRTPGIRLPRDMSELTSESFHDTSKSFPEWIAMITTLLSDILAKNDAFYAQLPPILQSDVTFGEEVLPVLVHTVLQADTAVRNNKSTASGVSCRRLLSNYFTSLLISNTVNNSCIRAIVDIILHLRHFSSPNNGDALSHDKWLDVDYTLLARNAVTCGAYTTALLFLELAAESREPFVPDDTVAEQIMFEIYSHIDEPDGFYGIKTKDLGQFLIKRFHHEKQWDKAFRFHGAALEAGTGGSAEAEGLTQAFHAFGFNRLAIETLLNPNFEAGPDSRISDMSYRSGWRTETWDLPDQTKLSNPDSNLYVALRAIHRERDSRTIDNIIRRTLREEMGRLKVLGTENLAEIREVNRNLMCISQVTQWRCPTIQKRLRLKKVSLSDWEDFVQIEPGFDFTDLENITATRISLIRAARQQEERDQIGDLVSPFARFLKNVEKKCLVRLSEAARGSDQVQIALNSIIRSQKLEASPTFDVSQEFASVLWLQREQKLAVQFLKELLNPDMQFADKDEIDPMKKAQLLARLGTWTAEACLEKPIDILTHFFQPATKLADSPQVRDPSRATVYHQFAIFAEHQYHATLKSSDAIRWKLYVERKVQEIKHVQELLKTAKESERQSLTQDLQKAQVLLQEDQELFQKHKGAREAFLSQAIDMYARCLEASDAFDDDGPIRLCSLWFSNFDVVDLQDKVQAALNRVQSRKFVFLAHQLAARLSKSHTQQVGSGQENLQKLMIRMCGEHPFHSLYQVYCLLPGRSPSAMALNSQFSRQSLSCQSEREAAASDIFNKLRGDSTKGGRVRDLERLCDASLQWAKHPIRQSHKGKKGPFRIPDEMLIRKLKKLKVPVATAHTPLDCTLQYDHCAWVESYDPEFSTAGGINLPKINICYGSDGMKYKQLFKGEGGDDPRQDAVMEQVFELVNIILRRDRETRRRNLSVRGYKVIPLDSQAGVLEFVGNTSPLRSWLNGAHTRYRPNDIHPNDAQEKLKQLENAGAQALLVAYNGIREKLKPVMRHYFTERHKNPISWFAMRLNYTRSVATTSIVGHILGLGDRHSSNILLDNMTGDVIHIDLGIAFDQGKYLKVPERVPFRMTPDMVDGMGISGTQGVFQRCAEETLRVLREGSEVIMTVLEVFKHDPLHSWTASELKLKRVQDTHLDSTFHGTAHLGIGIDMSSGRADEAADRALNSVTRKLDKALSVEYTVNELIADATDILNLATMFSGWGPHL